MIGTEKRSIMPFYSEEEYLQLAGLQHFVFCRRQWALIHLEAQWQENLRTVEGALLHCRAHDASLRERRGSLLILRGLPVQSRELGLSGQCDVVEFRAVSGGISLRGEEGLWAPFPVSISAGSPRSTPLMSCSSVHRPYALRRCSAAPSRRARSFTESPSGARP